MMTKKTPQTKQPRKRSELLQAWKNLFYVFEKNATTVYSGNYFNNIAL